MEEVCADTLEGICGLLWLSGRHGWVTWRISRTGGTGSPIVDHVCPEVGPVEGGGSSLKHGGGTGVACMEVLQHILSQGLRYDWTVVEHHNRSNIGEGMSVLEEILNLLIPVSALIRHSILDCVVEKFVLVTA